MRIGNNLVAQYFPEFDRFWKKAASENLSIVRGFLDPEEHPPAFLRAVYGEAGNAQGRSAPAAAVAADLGGGRQPIGCRPPPGVQLEATLIVETLNSLQVQLIRVERAIHKLAKGFEDYRYLKSIPGFGPYVSAVSLAAIGSPHRFENRAQLLRLGGFDLSANRSGQKSKTAVPVISKKGKADLRYALYQAALVASSSTSHFRDYFSRLLEGRQRKKASAPKCGLRSPPRCW